MWSLSREDSGFMPSSTRTVNLKTKHKKNQSQANNRERVNQQPEITKWVCGESPHCGHVFNPSLPKNDEGDKIKLIT